MMIHLRAWGMWAGIALILLTNAIVLGHVLLDRNHSPESTLRMSERELELPFDWGMAKENSGISLRIRYHILNGRTSAASTGTYFPAGGEFAFDGGDAPWLDDAHLAALGFDAKRLRLAATAKHGGAPTSKEVLLVLEFDGPAYAAAVERALRRRDEEAATAAANPGKEEFARRAKYASDAASFAEHQASRLFVVDAGLDREALRLKYPDRQRHAIVRGILQPVIAAGTAPAVRVERLSISEVAVPYAFRRPFEGLVPVKRTQPQDERRGRFETTVNWGQRLEPWMESATVH